MKRFIYTFMAFLMAVVAGQADAQVANGTYRALTDANSARVVALGGLPLPVHDGDLQNGMPS